LHVDGWITQRSGSLLTTSIDLTAQTLTAAVFDGLGGHRGGALASRTAAHELGVHQLQPDDHPGLRAAVQAVNRAVIEAGDRESTADLCTTVAGLVLAGDVGLAYNVGDSRVYRVVDGYLGQLSVDDRTRTDPGQRAMLTQSLGGPVESALDPHPINIDLDSAATYLLCSDGLHDVVTPQDMVAALGADRRPQRAVRAVADQADNCQLVRMGVQALVRAALERGAPDNISAIVLQLVPTDDCR
jgi:serine/threonine protein phosphatase PrpC